MVLALVTAQVLALALRKAVRVALAHLAGAARAEHVDPGCQPAPAST